MKKMGGHHLNKNGVSPIFLFLPFERDIFKNFRNDTHDIATHSREKA